MDWVQMTVTVICAVAASSGFWALIQSRISKHDANTRLLIGLAHDRICYLGLKYIERGYITQDEFENLNDYLYVPYHERGGNGSAQRVMETVKKLPFRA